MGFRVFVLTGTSVHPHSEQKEMGTDYTYRSSDVKG